jgi:hypothetical protein
LPAKRCRPSVRVLVRRFFRASASGEDDGEVLVDTSEGKYHVGEKWNYRTRPGEEDSLLTVVKVESAPNVGVIVHVSVEGLRVENPGVPGGVSERIHHMPFTEAAIDKSVTVLAATGVPVTSDAEEAYENWRRARGGVFTTTVAEAVELAAQAMSQ